jgi:O-antigen/teichoic acid export membrane protein
LSIRRNTAYNLLGALVPLAVSLVTIPIYLGLIGEARYGVLAIAWLLLGYFGLFDLGLGRATAQRIAALRDASAAERAETFWTALAMNLGLGVIGALVLWPVASYFFGHVFKIDETLRAELLAAVPWLMLAVPMATVSGVLTGALQGRERFLELNLISVLGTVVFQLLPLAVAAAGHIDLGTLLPAALLARVLTLLLLAWRCRAEVTQCQPVRLVPTQAANLLRFGGWVTVTAIVGPMMVILDRFIIGATAGAKAVTYYTVPFNLAERTTLLSGALTSALFPRFAALRREEEKQLAHEGLLALVVVMTPLTVAGMLLIEPFLAWWISSELAGHSSLVGQILLLGWWVNSFARIPFAQLQARGRPDIVAKCHLAELLPYLALLYLGLHFAGLAGAALAFSLRVTVDYLLLAGFAGTLRASLHQLAAPGVLLAGAAAIAAWSTPGSPTWGILAAVLLGLTLPWAWRQAPPALKQAAISAMGLDKNLRTSPSLPPSP